LEQGYRTTTPPVPPMVSRNGPNQAIVPVAIIAGIVIFVGMVVYFARVGYKATQLVNTSNSRRYLNQPKPQAVAVASQPVVWTTNSLTVADANKRGREFRLRQWLDGYEKRGQRNPSDDTEIVQFLQTWIARNYGGVAATNQLSLAEESDKLANDLNCTDPLVLTVVANNSASRVDATKRYERALATYAGSQHKAYPKFYANLMLAADLGERSEPSETLTTSALQLLAECFTDGSFTPDDQPEIAEILVNGWGENFFKRNPDSICAMVHGAGTNYQWLALVLDGEHEINEAWAARGSGYADTVMDAGQQSFSSHLATARSDLTSAWNLQPAWPVASARMMTVALGDSGIDEMRLWFDRTTTAQIDYPGAWSEMRWGLRPRWYGNEASMLAFGRTAIESGRFDTDVPRKYFDCVADVEAEMALPANRHIYGRADIWPDLQRLYDGYIAAPSQEKYRDGWRTSYAVVAYFAKKYEVARAQLEPLDWQPLPENLTGWNVDLSQMPLEVAARTGSLGKKISAAETLFAASKTGEALAEYKKLENSGADARTQQFIQARIASLQTATQLKNGGWLDFLPVQKDDPNWTFTLGQVQPLADGAVEVESAPTGHVLYCRTAIATNFEAKGQFEVVRPSGKNFFQAGLNFGDTSGDKNNWDSFRIRRYVGGDAVSIGRGWTKTEIFRYAKLNDVTNTFDFIFKDGRVTASVNGTEIFHETKPPAELAAPGNSFIVGLGALSQANTVIRYRNVQIRNLD
jgi:hypothetical protein